MSSLTCTPVSLTNIDHFGTFKSERLFICWNASDFQNAYGIVSIISGILTMVPGSCQVVVLVFSLVFVSLLTLVLCCVFSLLSFLSQIESSDFALSVSLKKKKKSFFLYFLLFSFFSYFLILSLGRSLAVEKRDFTISRSSKKTVKIGRMGFYVVGGWSLGCVDKQYYIFVGLELVGSPQFIDLFARLWQCMPPYEPTEPYNHPATRAVSRLELYLTRPTLHHSRGRRASLSVVERERDTSRERERCVRHWAKHKTVTPRPNPSLSLSLDCRCSSAISGSFVAMANE